MLVDKIFGESASDWTFVQIGAYDGQFGDDLAELVRRYRWRGVLIEPQPGPFERLKEFYRDQPQLEFRNIAIGEEGEQTMYTLKGHAGSTTASFQREHVRKHLRQGVAEEQIIAMQVSVKTLQTVMKECALESVDLLQIDAEGYDYAIISSIDFEKVHPRIIRYEHVHAARSHQDRLVHTLAKVGYRFIVDEMDTIAIRISEKE